MLKGKYQFVPSPQFDAQTAHEDTLQPNENHDNRKFCSAHKLAVFYGPRVSL